MVQIGRTFPALLEVLLESVVLKYKMCLVQFSLPLRNRGNYPDFIDEEDENESFVF